MLDFAVEGPLWGYKQICPIPDFEVRFTPKAGPWLSRPLGYFSARLYEYAPGDLKPVS